MLKAGIKQEQIEAIHKEAAQVIADAVQFADESPFPTPEDIWTDIYADIEPERI
jgi:pyruvate dehydrogenase E1 component alpha subunit